MRAWCGIFAVLLVLIIVFCPTRTVPADPSGGRAETGSSPEPVLPTRHTVRVGDNLYGLAKQYYGDGRHWRRILEANPDLQPTRIRVGECIRIPALDGE